MTSPCIKLDDANRMTEIVFVETFGEVATQSPWVAEYALGIRPFLNRNAMITAFTDGLYQAREDAQLELLRAQSCLGPQTLNAESRKRLGERPADYERTFGFPFVPADPDMSADGIVRHFEDRMRNARDAEFKTVLRRIAEIFRTRIESRVCPDDDNETGKSQTLAAMQDRRVPDLEPSS